jgi:hypothetical protein
MIQRFMVQKQLFAKNNTIWSRNIMWYLMLKKVRNHNKNIKFPKKYGTVGGKSNILEKNDV